MNVKFLDELIKVNEFTLFCHHAQASRTIIIFGNNYRKMHNKPLRRYKQLQKAKQKRLKKTFNHYS